MFDHPRLFHPREDCLEEQGPSLLPAGPIPGAVGHLLVSIQVRRDPVVAGHGTSAVLAAQVNPLPAGQALRPLRGQGAGKGGVARITSPIDLSRSVSIALYAS